MGPEIVAVPIPEVRLGIQRHLPGDCTRITRQYLSCVGKDDCISRLMESDWTDRVRVYPCLPGDTNAQPI